MMRISADKGESSASLVLNNIDLLTQILSTLPVETVLVLKPVSKNWYSLISGSSFMRKHYLLHHNKLSISGLFFYCDPNRLNNQQHTPIYDVFLLDKAKTATNVSFVIQVNEQPVGLFINQSCNGLLLCYKPSDIFSGTRYIYNPSTRHYRAIPRPRPFQSEIDWNPCYSQFYLAFSPLISLNYQIVFLWRTGDDMAHFKHQMAVFSSETGSWRDCGYVEFDSDLYRNQCIFWNGCLNWIDDTAGGPTLFYFNIAQQVLRQTSWLSNEMHNYKSEREYFGECTGHMYIILRASTSNFFGVFEMEIDYSGWKPVCRVDLGRLPNQYGNGGSVPINRLAYRILKVVVEGDGDEDELKVLIHVPHKIVSYDLKKKSFKEICHYQLGRYNLQASRPAYIGSLANV